jgi:hypothetical protein
MSIKADYPAIKTNNVRVIRTSLREKRNNTKYT